MKCSMFFGVVAFICFSMPMMASSSSGQFKLRVNLARRSGGGFHSTERLSLAVDRSKKRMNGIEVFVKQRIAGQLDAQTTLLAGDSEYFMSVAVGTPPVTFQMILDTGSDLSWTQCGHCERCSQSAPIFDSSKSSSYSPVACTDSLCSALYTFKSACDPDCSFRMPYGGGSRIIGDLARETFTIGSGSEGVFEGIAFGCGHDNQTLLSDFGGLVGLGRGPLSLISQLGSKVNKKFSYCLVSRTDNPSQTSPLIFGDSASLNGAYKTIPFIKNSASSSFWYIPLTGITVNGKAVDIPAGTFDLQSDGTRGMIIDSGTTLTYLASAAYSPVKEAIQTAINLTPFDGSSTVGLDLCYQTSSDVTLPTVVFNFEGGVDYELPGDNLFIRESGSLCLAMGGSESISIFGNVQQQNFHILYDNAHNTLSFMPTKCDSQNMAVSDIQESKMVIVLLLLTF